ncbi:hypothetical protein ACH41H_44770 [Streptomyces sp. NPDC020800]
MSSWCRFCGVLLRQRAPAVGPVLPGAPLGLPGERCSPRRGGR